MRKITFTIPGTPGLTITATEQGDGTILFELLLDGATDADIRGLFFDINDPLLIDNLQIDGTDVSNDGFGDVSDLGNGNNMKGRGGAPYDAGMSFGGPGDDDITSTSFVISSIDGTDLTLDLIANVRFGARLTAIGDRDGSAKLTFAC